MTLVKLKIVFKKKTFGQNTVIFSGLHFWERSVTLARLERSCHKVTLGQVWRLAWLVFKKKPKLKFTTMDARPLAQYMDSRFLVHLHFFHHTWDNLISDILLRCQLQLISLSPNRCVRSHWLSPSILYQWIKSNKSRETTSVVLKNQSHFSLKVKWLINIKINLFCNWYFYHEQNFQPILYLTHTEFISIIWTHNPFMHAGTSTSNGMHSRLQIGLTHSRCAASGYAA